VLGRNFFEFLLPESARPKVEDVVEALLRGESETNVVNQNLTQDGRVIICRWDNAVLRDVSGEVVGAMSLGMDITDRVKSEAEREELVARLEAQNAELEQFAYTVSHDLKSPLITLKGYLGLLREDVAGGDEESIADDFRRMLGATDTMERLLGELLELVRIGRVVNPPEEINLTQLARKAAELVHGSLTQRGVEVEIEEDLPVVFGDRPRLLEMLQNLIDNAVKYMGDQRHPRIEIGSRLYGGETICYVRDNGIGIDPRYGDKVFGLFEQLDRAVEGSGVGLALVRRIVEVHGGRVWAESEGPGKGATFCFTIPPATFADLEAVGEMKQ
jgi:signal transduction histidine kinase